MLRTLLSISLVLVLLVAAGCEPPKPKDPRDQAITDTIRKYPEAQKTRVMILGFDGADLDVIEPMVAAGELPNFEKAMAEGAYGRFRSQQPLLSPIIWTTIATGKPMDEHGIHDFWAVDPKTGRTKSISSVERKVEAIWDIVGRFDRKVGVVGWLATWPAEAVNGFIVSEKVGLLGYEYRRREDEPVQNAVRPPELMEQIQPLIRKVGDVTFEEMKPYLNITEEEFRAKYERKASPGNLVNNHRLQYATAETFHEVGLSLWKSEKPDLMAWYFEYLDATCHLFMPYAAPRQEHISEKDFNRYQKAVPETYRYCDRILGEAMAAADENTVIIVVSDHGFRSDKLRLKEGADFKDRTAVQWHRLFGTIMVWGKGVKPGVKIPASDIYDITPTVLSLMGFPQAADMKGSFIASAFDTPPVEEVIDTYGRGRRVKIQIPGEDQADELTRAKLEALGYVGPEQTISSNLNLAGYLMSEGRFEEAIAEFKKASEKQPTNAKIWAQMGKAYRQLNDFRRAEEHLRMAAKLDPHQFMARLELANLLHRTNRLPAAKKEILEVIDAAPGMGMAWVGLGRVHLAEKNAAKAEESFRKAVEVEPGYTQGRIQLGLLLLRTGRRVKAEREFRAVVELEPGNRIAWNNIGVIQLQIAAAIRDPQTREEAFDRALKTFDTIIKRFPKYSRGYGNRAKIRVIRRQFPQAVEDYEKAIELDPDYAAAREGLAALRGKGSR